MPFEIYLEAFCKTRGYQMTKPSDLRGRHNEICKTVQEYINKCTALQCKVFTLKTLELPLVFPYLVGHTRSLH
jgi:hypothetical protein